MKQLLMAAILFSCVPAQATLPPPEYLAKSSLFFVPVGNSAVTNIANMKSYRGGMFEVHSDPAHRLHPGGPWNIEVRLREGGDYGYLFWVEDRDEPLYDSKVDIRSLDALTIVLLDKPEGQLKLSIVPSIVEKELPVVALSTESFGLINLCLKSSAIVVDDSFLVDQVDGFGERVFVGIAGIADIEFSLKKLRDWSIIGELNDGQIRIKFGDVHSFTVTNVGIGPGGYRKGGPFAVYGTITKPERSREQSEASKFSLLERRLKGAQLDLMKQAVISSPYISGRITIGNDNDPGPYIPDAIGGFFDGQECG